MTNMLCFLKVATLQKEVRACKHIEYIQRGSKRSVCESLLGFDMEHGLYMSTLGVAPWAASDKLSHQRPHPKCLLRLKEGFPGPVGAEQKSVLSL